MTDLLTDILVCLGILAVAAGLFVLGLMLAGIFDAGPMAHWWTARHG